MAITSIMEIRGGFSHPIGCSTETGKPEQLIPHARLRRAPTRLAGASKLGPESLKGSTGCRRSRVEPQKMLPKTPPKRVWRPSLEKVASRTLPETPLCAENIAPAMLFTLPRRCPQPSFRLHFGSHWEAFWVPLASQSRLIGEKEAFRKSIKKGIEKGVSKSQK